MLERHSSKPKSFFRQSASGAFDQYLQDIQKLPLIDDPAEERRLARLAQKGDPAAAERLLEIRHVDIRRRSHEHGLREFYLQRDGLSAGVLRRRRSRCCRLCGLWLWLGRAGPGCDRTG